MNRQLIVAGNWKMNKNLIEAFSLASEILAKAKKMSNKVEIVLAPPAPYLHTINSMSKDIAHVNIAAQNCHYEPKGAYTGEISAEMLASMNLTYVILGHSERRKFFQEDHEVLAKKVDAAIRAGVKVIFCCGEPLEEREANQQENFVLKQLKESLFHLSQDAMKQVVIAYEPIWAIGTGKTASPAQAQEMHQFIRHQISEHYTAELANACSILYGGSCKPSNAAELFAQKDVDGGLVGGASLQSEDFLQIIQARAKQA
ncbi:MULTISPECIES: triose-phosphate isomerase [unclassified Aureispira]|uniref:triose-phosphate isomerase n=1 Tax=unclassified Aureispira TaxID=2649989 RepID=UPI0006984AA8|nr:MULTISPECIES: triose-phosphate isomerase [unclassified Aureispira]WMX16097.1 triose-phosphate isomerase [Aureispira sp. CCB-E]